jgi:hypothetical protein
MAIVGVDRRRNHVLDLLIADPPRRPGARLIDEPGQPIHYKPLVPLAHLGCDTPSSAATSLLGFPAAQPNTIRHGSTSACEDFARRGHRSNISRSSSANTNSATGRPLRVTHTLGCALVSIWFVAVDGYQRAPPLLYTLKNRVASRR